MDNASTSCPRPLTFLFTSKFQVLLFNSNIYIYNLIDNYLFLLTNLSEKFNYLTKICK